MAKILYPVGTPVTVRKSPETEGLVVTQYVKGEKYPYRVGFYPGDQVIVGEKYKFSKAGLKRYNPTQAKVDQGNAPEQPEPTATNKNCGQCSELSKVVSQAIDEIMSRMADVRDVAAQAYENSEENRHAIMQIAELADANFRTVSKQFKKLSHDDD